MDASVLIIENNKQASDLITFALNREGCRTIRACKGQDGLRLLRTRKPDIALLDLPEGLELDSFDVCTQIEEEALDVAVLVFVEEDESDLAEALDLEYIIKPFTIRELLEHIKLMLLRIEQKQTVQILGRFTIDTRKAIVCKDNNPIDMSLQDYDLFCYLATQPGKVFSRETLMIDVWGFTDYLGDVRLVDVAIRRLRMRIEDDPSRPQFIMTRRKMGYYFQK